MTNHIELKRLADSAYGAKFQTEGFEQTDGRGQHYGGLILHENGHTIIASCVMQPWADFIAAASPAAIQELIAEIAQLKAENERLHSASKTLKGIGYTDCDGQQWKPPIGEKPRFDLIDELRAEVSGLKTGYQAYERVNAELKAENEALRDGANFRAIQSLRQDCDALRKDAEIGRLIFQFFDRMDDPADCDPLEKSTGEFLRAVSAAMGKGGQS